MSENNAIPNGFKMTEFGPLPEEWNIKEVRDIAEVITGKTPNTKNTFYWGGDIPFITPPDLKGWVVRSAGRFITQVGLEVSKPLPKGTVLVSCIGYIGKVGVVDCPLAVTNQQINAAIPDYDLVDNWFLAFLFMFIEPYLKDRASMTTVPILNKRALLPF